MRRALLLLILIVGAASCERQPLGIKAVSIASNIHVGDYVGPEACGDCHSERFAQWSGNLHRSMNRRASDPDAIVGDFSGITVEYGGGRATFSTKNSERLMTLESPAGRVITYRVTRTIGARYIQEYVGVEVSPRSSDLEVRLPFGYWLRERAWFHQQYFDSWFGNEIEASGAPAVDAFKASDAPWETRCAWCHNTYAFDLRVARAQSSEPRGHGPEVLYTSSVAPTVVGNRLPSQALVTVGISCESCHFGGREHTAGEPIRFAPYSSSLELRDGIAPLTGKRDDAQTINRICAQCHSAPSPRWPSGASQRNSSEALDMERGACASAIKCTDCHDPHMRGQPAGSATQTGHINACVRCHQDLSSPQAQQAHAGHAPATATCIDCHMPAIVQGFSGQLRSHRISSPTAHAVLEGTEPDACGLCHLDRSSHQIALELTTMFGRRPRAGDWDDEIYLPIGERWLASPQPIIAVTAAAAIAARPPKSPQPIAKKIAARLNAPVAYYRMRFYFALKELLGDVDFSPTGTPASRAREQRALIESLR